MPIPNYPAPGGRYSEMAPLANIFASLDIRAPHTGQPYSEAMLFGVSGGINLAHFVFEYELEDNATFVLLGAHRGNYEGGALQELICQRLGVPCLRKETSGEKAAQRHLEEALRADRPLLGWADLSLLTYYNMPENYFRMFSHTLAVCGQEGADTLLLDDRAPEAWRMPWDAFIEARAATPAQHNRLLAIGRPEANLTIETAIELGLAHCLDNLLKPNIRDFGIEGLERLAECLADPESRKGWPQNFYTTQRQYNALKDLYQFIEYGYDMGGAGGGLLRGLFAEFLDEAAEVMNNPALRNVAADYRHLAQSWRILADTALPQANEYLAQTRELVIEKNRLIEEEGPASAAKLAEQQAAINRMEQAADKEFQPSAEFLDYLYGDLQDQLRELARAERAAAQELQRAVYGRRSA